MKRTVHFSSTSVAVDESALFSLQGLCELQEQIFATTADYLRCVHELENPETQRQEINQMLATYERNLGSVREFLPELGKEVSLFDEVTISDEVIE